MSVNVSLLQVKMINMEYLKRVMRANERLLLLLIANNNKECVAYRTPLKLMYSKDYTFPILLILIPKNLG
jgi:hypothetical protein